MNAPQSPLFEPVLWDGNGFRILDELSLPDRIEYIDVRDASQALAAVREMKTRAFGQVLTFLYSGALVAQAYKGREAEPLRQRLAQMTDEFCAARPTFDFRGLGSDLAGWFDKIPPPANVGEWIAQQARELGAKIVRARDMRARRAASLLPAAARVMTHCNVSGELVAVARHCAAMGKEFSVIATETRPYLQGMRLTAWELARAGVAVSIIPDCAIAQVMAKGEVDAVIVGADRSAQNGDIINKVGTYPLALMAKEYAVPFHALVQEPRSVASGVDVPIEERPGVELLNFQGQPLIAAPDSRVAARYPAFDMTPAALITRLVDFDDVYTPETFRQKYQKQPAPKGGSARQEGKYLLVYGVPGKASYAFLKHALTAEQADGILVPEMRPELWGARIVARELLHRGTALTLIADNMMGTLFAQGEIRKLYLFYDELNERGLSSACGSLFAVRLARAHGVPIELLESEQNRESPIDRDVSTFLAQRIMPAGVSVHPVEKETIPWSLLKEE